MAEERKVAFVMQARLNSQRVPNKMLKPFAGKTLFEIALRKVLESDIPKKDVYIALGDDELLEAYDQILYSWCGFEIFTRRPNLYKRSPESCNATNDPNKPDSLKLLYEWYKELMDEGYTHVVLFNPCHPLVEVNTIEMFYKQYSLWDNDQVSDKGLFTVTVDNNYFWDLNHKPLTDWKGAQLMNTNKVDPIYAAAHVLYGSRLDDIEQDCWMGKTSPPEPVLWRMNKKEAFDVDTLEDFEMAEAIYKAERNKKYDWRHKYEYGMVVKDDTPKEYDGVEYVEFEIPCPQRYFYHNDKKVEIDKRYVRVRVYADDRNKVEVDNEGVIHFWDERV